MSQSNFPVGEDVLALVEPRFREAFLRFVDTGELESGFEAFLDENESCQRAVEAVAEMQLDAMSAAGEELRAAAGVTSHPTRDNGGVREPVAYPVGYDPFARRPVEDVTAGIALVVTGAAQMSASEMAEAAPRVVRQLESALSARHVPLTAPAAHLAGMTEIAVKIAEAAEQRVGVAETA